MHATEHLWRGDLSPLGGAAVSIIVDGKTFTNETSSFGIQEWAGVPIGTYTIAVTKYGYADGTANVTVTSGATAAATVIMTSISPPGDARITVTDGTNLLSEATVAVTVNGQPRTATTFNGVITFADLPAGTYSFGAYKDNYSSTSIEGVVITSSAVTEATIKLTRQTGKMTIKVRDQNLTIPASYVEGATVTVTGSGIAQGVTRTVESDSTSNAVFSALPTGSYTFSVTKSGYTSGSGTFTITNDCNDSQIVKIAQSLVNIGLYVKEYVESGPESMLGGVTVTVTNGAYSETQTTTEGVTMSFYNVPAGNCTFTLTKPGYTTITQTRLMPDEGTAPIFIMYKN